MVLHKRWLAAFSAISIVILCYAESYQQLVITTTSGVQTSYRLDDEPKVRFTGQTLVIETKNTTVEFSITETDRISYETINESSISTIESDASDTFDFNGRDLTIFGQNYGISFYLYGIDGRLWLSREIPAGVSQTISLSTLVSGTYLVKINSSTHKLVVK